MLIDITASNREVLLDTLRKLTSLRREAEAIPEQPDIASVIEAVESYRTALLGTRNRLPTKEWCGRAIADVTHEVAAARYGWESAEADAVFDDQDKQLTQLLRALAIMQTNAA